MTVAFDPRLVARALGGDAFGSQITAPGPGHSARDRSLSVRLDPSAPGGFVVHSHAGDDPIVCKDYVRQRLGLPSWQPGDEQDKRIAPRSVSIFDHAAVQQESEPRQRTDDDLLRINRAQQVWAEAGDPRGTLAEQYLHSRCLLLPNEMAGSVLRFHPGCPWRNENTGQTGRVPALITAFRSIDDNEITAVHRIALNPNGTKRARRMLGLVHRAAVKLDTTNGDTLAIGEGVETCMAGRQLGVTPVWALGSVGAISFFPVLDHIKVLKIFAEAGKASADAVEICGRRWTRAGRRVRIVRPPVGSDLNDTLIAEMKR
jgi:putative DNA primase/helicase